MPSPPLFVDWAVVSPLMLTLGLAPVMVTAFRSTKMPRVALRWAETLFKAIEPEVLVVSKITATPSLAVVPEPAAAAPEETLVSVTLPTTAVLPSTDTPRPPLRRTAMSLMSMTGAPITLSRMTSNPRPELSRIVSLAIVSDVTKLPVKSTSIPSPIVLLVTVLFETVTTSTPEPLVSRAIPRPAF